MFGGWFTDRTHATNSRKNVVHNDENIVTTQSESSFTSPPSQQDSIRYSGSEQNELDKSPILSTPHDAIVNEMNEKIREIELASPSRPMPSVDPGRDGENSHPAGEHTRTRSRLADNVYDPFTGQSIGNYVPGDYPESEDDLWTHLKRIRDLQSQIAMMHSQMEGLGTNDRSLRVEQSIGDDEAMNFEEDAKEAKKEEFQKLADRFSGRKDAIDAIMNKVSLKVTQIYRSVLSYLNPDSWKRYRMLSMIFIPLENLSSAWGHVGLLSLNRSREEGKTHFP